MNATPAQVCVIWPTPMREIAAEQKNVSGTERGRHPLVLALLGDGVSTPIRQLDVYLLPSHGVSYLAM